MMKRLLMSLLAAYAFCANAMELPSDGGFEKGSGGLPAGWVWHDWPAFLPHADADVVNDGGARVLHYHNVRGKSGSAIRFVRTAAGVDGDFVTVKFESRGTGKAWFSLYCADKKGIFVRMFDRIYADLSDKWCEHSFSFKIEDLKGRKVAACGPLLGLTPRADAYFRNVRLCRGIVPVKALSRDDYERESPRPGNPKIIYADVTSGTLIKTGQGVYDTDSELEIVPSTPFALPKADGRSFAQSGFRLYGFGTAEKRLSGRLVTAFVGNGKEFKFEVCHDSKSENLNCAFSGGGTFAVPYSLLPSDFILSIAADGTYDLDVKSLVDSGENGITGSSVALAAAGTELMRSVALVAEGGAAEVVVDEVFATEASVEREAEIAYPYTAKPEKAFDPVKAGWPLVFDGGFDGEKIDETKWHFHSRGLRKEYAALDGKGTLRIRADYFKGTNRLETTGLETADTYLYGYFESRLKFTKESGWWAAFWLCSPGTGNAFIDGFEIDGFEDYHTRTVKPEGEHRKILDHNLHTHCGMATKSFNYGSDFGGDWDDWHVFGVKWTPFEITYYLDGKAIVPRTKVTHSPYDTVTFDAFRHAVSVGPVRAIVSGQIMGPHTACHDPTGFKIPEYFDVDYVRVYAYPGAAEGMSPEVLLKTSADGRTTLAPGEMLKFSVSAKDAAKTGAKVKAVHLFDNGYYLATKSGPPYEFTVPFTKEHYAKTCWMKPGRTGARPEFAGTIHAFCAFAEDEKGEVGHSGVAYFYSKAAGKSTPYEGKAQKIPGTVKAGRYDAGGQGVAYADTSVGNSKDKTWRKDESVDCTEDMVANLACNEWLKYTVDVAETGRYRMRFKYGTPSRNMKFLDLLLDGERLHKFDLKMHQPLHSLLDTPAEAEVTLPAGRHVLTLYHIGSLVQFGNLEFVAVDASMTNGFTVLKSASFADGSVWKVNNFAGKFTVERAEHAADGRKLVLTLHSGTNKTDTAWALVSERIPIPPHAKGFTFRFGVAAAMYVPRLVGCFGGGGGYENLVRWYDAAGKEIGHDMLAYSISRKVVCEKRLQGPVPAGAAFCTLHLGYDYPNIKDGEWIAFGDAVFSVCGQALHADFDCDPPHFKLLTPSPTLDRNVILSFEAEDASGIDFSSVKFKVDGIDATVAFVREGRVYTLTGRAGPWSNGVHAVEIAACDICGNEAKVKRAFMIGKAPMAPKIVLRDDGMTLVDGRPYFPIGAYAICRREFNGNDFDRAFKDLQAAGFNLGHTYNAINDPEYHAAARKYGFPCISEARAIFPDDAFVVGLATNVNIIAWVIGDDTSVFQTPAELLACHDSVRAVDPNRLTSQADAVSRLGPDNSGYVDYAGITDLFLPELYPVRKENGLDASSNCVAHVIRDMKMIACDVARKGGGRPRGCWPIIQAFKGWGAWPTYPTREQIYAMTFAAIVHGAHGITWYTYGARGTNEGINSTPERWRDISFLATWLKEISPALVERKPVQPAPPEVVKGPPTDAFGHPSVSMLLKRCGDDVYLIAVNSAPSSVRARFTSTGLGSSAEVMRENRRVAIPDGAFEDDFGPLAVHVYKAQSPSGIVGSPALSAGGGLYTLGGAKFGFRMTFGTKEEKAPRFVVNAERMKSVSGTTNDAGVVTVTWKGHPKIGGDFSVTATFTPEQDGGWAYAFHYAGNASGLDVEEIHFPEIEVPRADSSRFLYPRQVGLLERPKWETAKQGQRLVVFGPRFKGFHFVALFTEGASGWYLDTRGQSRRHPVSFALYNGTEPSTARIVGSCTLAASAALAGDLPYDGVIRPFDGNWHAAARIYRKWAVKEPVYQRALELRRATPRLRDIGVWLWNRGSSSTVTGVVDRVRADTEVPVALDWYWWHDIPYGAGAPYYWPPREDAETFTGTIRALKAKGVYVQNYINGMCCDVDDPRWTDADWAETAVNRDGSYFTSTFNKFIGHPSAWMCGSAPIFHSRIAALAKQLAESGVDAVYIDMIANDACYSCWSTVHPHPRGGGTHVADGYVKMVERIRRENPHVHFSSEEETESFLGLFESLIVLYGDYERFGIGVGPDKEMVPVFPAVYHEAVTTYGNFATIDNVPPWDGKWPAEKKRRETRDLVREFPDQFAVEVARPVVWGIQPCVHHLLPKHAAEPKFAADYRFLCDTAKFYYANRDLLYDGEMLAPGKLVCDVEKVEFLQRSTYTADGAYTTHVQPALETLFHSVWRAPGGRVSAVLVNWSRAPRTFRLETPDMGVIEGVVPPRSWIRR